MREDVFTIRTVRKNFEYEEWFKTKVEAGLKAIESGRVLSNNEVHERAMLRRERLLTASQNKK